MHIREPPMQRAGDDTRIHIDNTRRRQSKKTRLTHITARSCQKAYLAIDYSHDEPPGGNPKLRYRIQTSHSVRARAYQHDSIERNPFYQYYHECARICPRKNGICLRKINLSQTESSMVCPYRTRYIWQDPSATKLSKNRENANNHQPRDLAEKSFSPAASFDGAILILAAADAAINHLTRAIETLTRAS